MAKENGLTLKYLFILLALSGCAYRGRTAEDEMVRKAVRAAVPYKMSVCHVDPEFTDTEYVKIQNAGSAWGIETEYHQTFSVPQDLHFNDVSTLQPCTIVKVYSGSRLVKKVDAARLPGAPVVLAFTNGQRVYMIADRIPEVDFFWTITHEMGHVLGLPDLEDRGHVMSGVGPFTGDWFDDTDHHTCEIYRVCP